MGEVCVCAGGGGALRKPLQIHIRSLLLCHCDDEFSFNLSAFDILASFDNFDLGQSVQSG